MPVTRVYSSWMVVLCLEIKSNFLVTWKASSFSSGILRFFSTTDSFSCRSFSFSEIFGPLEIEFSTFSSPVFMFSSTPSDAWVENCSISSAGVLITSSTTSNVWVQTWIATNESSRPLSSSDVTIISFSTSDFWVAIGSWWYEPSLWNSADVPIIFTSPSEGGVDISTFLHESSMFVLSDGLYSSPTTGFCVLICTFMGESSIHFSAGVPVNSSEVSGFCVEISFWPLSSLDLLMIFFITSGIWTPICSLAGESSPFVSSDFLNTSSVSFVWVEICTLMDESSRHCDLSADVPLISSRVSGVWVEISLRSLSSISFAMSSSITWGIWVEICSVLGESSRLLTSADVLTDVPIIFSITSGVWAEIWQVASK